MSCLISYVYMHSIHEIHVHSTLAKHIHVCSYMSMCGYRTHWLELFHGHYMNCLRRLKHRLAPLDTPP